MNERWYQFLRLWDLLEKKVGISWSGLWWEKWSGDIPHAWFCPVFFRLCSGQGSQEPDQHYLLFPYWKKSLWNSPIAAVTNSSFWIITYVIPDIFIWNIPNLSIPLWAPVFLTPTYFAATCAGQPGKWTGSMRDNGLFFMILSHDLLCIYLCSNKYIVKTIFPNNLGIWIRFKI